MGAPLPALLAGLLDDLEARYPGRIWRDQPWIFSNAGGAMVQLKVLYASFREYLLIFGTPIGTEGHSGRHLVAFDDVVLDGEIWYHGEGDLERRVYRPGDVVVLERGDAAGIRVPDRVWMLEYACGAIPLSLPFGLADSVFSTLDVLGVVRTLRIFAVLAWRSILPLRSRRG